MSTFRAQVFLPTLKNSDAKKHHSINKPMTTGNCIYNWQSKPVFSALTHAVVDTASNCCFHSTWSNVLTYFTTSTSCCVCNMLVVWPIPNQMSGSVMKAKVYKSVLTLDSVRPSAENVKCQA